MNKLGLVLEGGGNRGIYTAGVLDTFLEENITVDGVIGVSAGSIHGASFISGQKGRSINYTKKYCRDPRYMSFKSWRKTGNYVGVDFCYHELPEKLFPFDNDTFENSPMKFYVTATDVQSGEAVYHYCPSLRGEKIEWVRASASLPIISEMVEIDGRKYLDGGIADSLPIEAMRRLGYTKNIVILTRPAGYSKQPNKMMPIIKCRMKDYPAFIHAAETRHEVYNDELARLEQLSKTGEVCLIRPSKDLKVGRLEKNPEKIQSLYDLGCRDAHAQMTRIKNFITNAETEKTPQ